MIKKNYTAPDIECVDLRLEADNMFIPSSKAQMLLRNLAVEEGTLVNGGAEIDW